MALTPESHAGPVPPIGPVGRAGPVDAVPALVEGLRAALVPEVGAATVRWALAVATAAQSGLRGRDGRRASALTPSGAPFEASVTGGGGRSAAALRYVSEPGAGQPFFGPRLAAQRTALDALAELLPPGAAPAAGELRALPEVLFPDVGAVPARTRFATFLGVVHTARHAHGPAALKVYGNLEAVDPAAALARLGARWAGFRRLAELVAGDVGADGPLSPQFVCLDAGVDGVVRPKVYVRTRTPGPAALRRLAGRLGADLGALAGALEDAGLSPRPWRRPVFACLAGDPTGDSDAELSAHVPARAVDLDEVAMADLAGRLAGAHGAADGWAALCRAMAAARGVAVTVVGVGLPAGGGVGKVNVYAAPARTGRA